MMLSLSKLLEGSVAQQLHLKSVSTQARLELIKPLTLQAINNAPFVPIGLPTLVVSI